MNPGEKIYHGRFAILCHQPPPAGLASETSDISPHWDLLLETGGEHLLTWRIDALPNPAGWTGHRPQRIPILRLPDHRRLYLDYQGAIGGNRGSVRRVAEGVYQAVFAAADQDPLAVRKQMEGWHGPPSTSEAPQSPLPPLIQASAEGSPDALQLLLSLNALQFQLLLPLAPIATPSSMLVFAWPELAR